MAVKISGVLKDGTGKPVQNCTIQLKAKRNSTTVVVNTLASENPDEAGRYSMDVEYGQYSVILLVEGFPPSHAGTITVYEDSRPGTLNDFLGAMTEDDARPEALRRFELMVEEVARNASAVAQNTAAVKKSASDASTSAREAATHATDAAGSARAASTSAGQAASSAQSASSSAMFSDSMDSISRWLVGSSMIRMFGFCIINLPKSIRPFSPPESTLAGFLMSSWLNSKRPRMLRSKGIE